MNTTIDNNNNDLLNGLINVLVNSITEKVTAKLEANIENLIDKKIKDIDFEEIVRDNIDESSIIESIEGNLDLSDQIRCEVDDAIERHDFTDAITDALDSVKLTVKVDRN